ncbi:glycosyl transferase family 1 [Novosphingobium guangzhouense]|uniref:Glycosyl transferase family 1 n=1 Tax=Novosphingobium guangzhouense TaxID=1850347 RepID=A0A2K2G2E6_9SPHN|nr:glycosyl transferase family 1 [Novosphingobium guangzhouense]
MIDGYNLGLEKGTGVATYARNLSLEIGNLGHEVSVLYGNGSSSSRDKLLREISFFDTYQDEGKGLVDKLQRIASGARGPRRHKAVDIPMSGKVVTSAFVSKLPHYDSIWNAPDLFRRSQSAFHAWGGLSSVDLPQQPDLAHWTYPLALKVPRRPNIYTLHDIVPLRLPYTTLDNKRAYLKLIRKLDRTADHFVTVSECSKRDLVEIAGIAPERITNTYQSVSIPDHLKDKPEEQVAREVEGFAEVGYKDYVLFWGSIEPKKNIGRMIEAYLASKADIPLVIVGAQAWKSKKELQLLNEGTSGVLDAKGQGGRKGIIRLPYAPFSVLVSLIRGARAAIFPSLYEGFGLPALEAMLLGTPVLCSNTASLPEVAGEAALMVDPYDSDAIAAGMRRILADADLRKELSLRGQVQAQRFSPAAYRARLADVYQRFL